MSSSLTYFSGRAARRLRKRVAAVLMSTALAAASTAWAADKPGDIEADALRSVLTAEIALQRGLYPQAWRQFMNAAQSLKNAELAGRAYDAASAAGNTENAQIALELWHTLDPKTAAWWFSLPPRTLQAQSRTCVLRPKSALRQNSKRQSSPR